MEMDTVSFPPRRERDEERRRLPARSLLDLDFPRLDLDFRRVDLDLRRVDLDLRVCVRGVLRLARLLVLRLARLLV